MRRPSSLLAAGTVFALCAISSSAQTLGPITTTTPIAFSLTDFTGTLTFPQFNDSLGTLDSVTLDFSSTLATTFTFMNNSSAFSPANKASTAMTISIEDAGDNLLANDPQLDISSSQFLFSLAPGATTNISQSITGDSGYLTYTAAAILGEFTGGGNIALNVNTFTGTTEALRDGNISSAQATEFSLTGTVTYDYSPDPIPEPSTFALLVLGLGVLPLFRPRLQRK